MAKASDNPYPSILLEDHADPTAPADGFKRLFVDTDEKLKMIDHASLVTDFTPAAGLLNKYDATVAPDADNDTGEGYAVGSIWVDVTGDDAYICVDATEGAAVWNPFEAAGGGGIVPWPDTIPGSPNANDQEFNAALSGETVLGTLDTNDVATYPGLLWLERTAAAWRVDGIYWATPAIPFTLTAKVAYHNVANNYQHAGIFIAEATPGKIQTLGPSREGSVVVSNQTWTNPTTRASNQPTGVVWRSFYRIVVTSASSVQYQHGALASTTAAPAIVWTANGAASNPGFTPASWGVFVLDYSGNMTSICFDWVRFVTGTAGQTWNGSAWV